MTLATKTINPLHFEDLEPHRFEDLIRQLIYDYKEWQSLEATGRQGSDDGFDVRGWEVTNNGDISTEDEEIIKEDRIWLIQCKREKSISPKKLINYLDNLNNGDVSSLYGLIFVAACDFSKQSRDKYRAWCREKNIAEFHILGKAELEDMLFQPKYDHLLFAYFGISLQIRKRLVKNRLRSILAVKRQVKDILGNEINDFVLLRDPSSNYYPYHTEIKDFNKCPPWRICQFIGFYHSGLMFTIKSHYAYIDDERIQWDYDINSSYHTYYDDPWNKEEENLASKVNSWNNLPENNRAILHIIWSVPYDEILAIDGEGDDWFNRPHIYMYFNSKYEKYCERKHDGMELLIEVVGQIGQRYSYRINTKNQIKVFPTTYPNVESNE